MQTQYNVTFRDGGESRASVILSADSAAEALREAAAMLGMDTDPFTQTYTLALIATPCKSQRKPIKDLKAGDIVAEHGATFRVLTDAIESETHRARHWDCAECIHVMHEGPTNCAWTEGECISGEIPGYFKPGSRWTFQGTAAVSVWVIG